MSIRLETVADVAARIVEAWRQIRGRRCVLVAVSGIDASGNGFVSSQIVDVVMKSGLNVAALNVDGWLNLPPVRFADMNPARNFYANAIRFEEMFTELVLPLRNLRSIRVEVNHAEETATTFRRRTYDFSNVDVIVIEGIFLLKKEYRAYYDVSLWIDCTFETALERAVARVQEGLAPAETVAAFRHIYFPAQEIHFNLDDPVHAAMTTFVNDPRLTGLRRQT